jgi:hypothetical protein
MAGISFDVVRTGKRYRLTNHGEVHEFVVEKILSNGDFKVKDLLTMERYLMKDLIKYGQGNDYFLEAIDG